MSTADGLPYKPPPLEMGCITFVVTGCVSAALFPFWANWARAAYPEISFNATVSRAAGRFVSAAALKHLLNGVVIDDDWDAGGEGKPVHRDLARATDGWAVFPASLNTVAKLASGVADTPALAALQMTTKPIIVAPSFPEGAMANPIVGDNVRRLCARPNVRFIGGDRVADGGVGIPSIFEALAEAVRSR